MKPYVIIGNGVSAVGCIEGIRSRDKKRPIVVVSYENHHVYGRPLISYYLEGKTDLERMKYRSDDFYEKNGCTVLYGVKAEKLSAEERTVFLDNGKTLSYRSVCVATGSSPFVPPFKGLENVEHKYPFMTIDDMLNIEKAIDKDKNVLIVGAGLIGLKCAEGVVERVKSVTVCDLADRVLSSILDSECASLMEKALADHGVKFMLKDSVAEFKTDVAVMNSGKEVPFDVVILAVGVRANSSILKEAGAKANRGVIVDEKCRTSLKGVYASGDVTECFDVSLGANRVLAILPNAYLQGHCAGVNMAGGNSVLDNSVMMNSIGFFGMHAMSAGSYFGKEDGGTVIEDNANGIKRLYVKDGYLTGFMIIGKAESAGIYTNLIRQKIKLSSDEINLLKNSASLSLYSHDKRRKILEGVV
ncbi:MAG: NAD(P)/FAD-dependent oxidoreductase [Christensenellaceae bacterium]